MENRETYNGKTPFYMTYPMQNLYLAEMEYEKDMERMKELYPKELNELQQMIERRADQMEYEGSRMYDENPDKEMLREEARRIYEEFLKWLEEQQWGMQPSPPMPPMGQPMPPMGQPMPPMGQPMPPMERPMPPMERPMPPMGQPMPPMGQPMPPMERPMPQMQQPGMQNPSQMQGEQNGRFMLNPPREWGEIMLPNSGALESMELPLQQAQYQRRCDNPWLCNLVDVMFNNEIYRRRCRNRRCRRWW